MTSARPTTDDIRVGAAINGLVKKVMKIVDLSA